jgi:hypothetical protein
VASVRIGRAAILDSVIDLFADRQSSNTAGDFDNEAMFFGV